MAIQNNNFLFGVQNYICGRLSTDAQLSSVDWLSENRRDIETEIKTALGKQGIVGLVLTPKATFRGKYEDKSLAWEIEELEIDVVENPVVNRGRLSVDFPTGQDAATRVFDVLSPTVEGYGEFSPVSYEQGTDGSLLVNKCVFKCLVLQQHEEPPPPPHLSSNVEFSDGTTLNPDWSGTLSHSDVQRALGTKIGLATDIFIGEDVTGVDDEAFSYMESLSSVTFGDSVAELGGWILRGCPVQTLVIPETVERIAYGGLGGMDQIQTIKFLGRTEEQVSQSDNFPFGVENWQTVFQYGD